MRERPDTVAEKYGRYAGQSVDRGNALQLIELGRSRIVVVSPANLQHILPGLAPPTIPFLAGFTVSSNLCVTKRALQERAVDFLIHKGRIVVNAKDGYGTAVLFENAQ